MEHAAVTGSRFYLIRGTCKKAFGVIAAIFDAHVLTLPDLQQRLVRRTE